MYTNQVPASAMGPCRPLVIIGGAVARLNSKVGQEDVDESQEANMVSVGSSVVAGHGVLQVWGDSSLPCSFISLAIALESH